VGWKGLFNVLKDGGLGFAVGWCSSMLAANVIFAIIRLFIDWLRGRSTCVAAKPIQYTYSFVKWCNPSPTDEIDNRPEAVKLTDLVHEQPLYAKVKMTRRHIPFWDHELKMKVSVETLAQISHHSNLSPMLDDRTSAVKLDNAAGKLMSVNMNKYKNLSEQNITTNSFVVANGIRKAQQYRLEEAKVPFPRAGNLVG
jgi:hypothetical protein